MQTSAIKTKYASVKAVLRFFGTRENAIMFPSAFDKSNADEKLFLQAAKAVIAKEPNENGERIVKPEFSFGKVLVKMSKNAGKFALAQCTIYITEYVYKPTGEKRCQIVIAPPSDNSEFEDIDIDNDDWLGTKPASAPAADDTDDEDDDNE